MNVIALLMMLLGTAWAGDPPRKMPEAPYYEAAHLQLGLTLRSLDKGGLRDLVIQERHGRVKYFLRQLPDGTRVPVKFRQLDEHELIATMIALAFDLEHGEADLVISAFTEELHPVTVWWDAPRTLVFETGAPMAPSYDPTLTPESIADRFGLPPFVDDDRVWDYRSLGLVAEALSQLSPQELEVVRDVPWVRASAPTEAVVKDLGMDPSAAYIDDVRGPRIEVYDRAVAPPPRFVGSAHAPMPVAYHTVLHELGHALARSRVRLARQEFIELKDSLEGLTDEERQPAVNRMGSLAQLLDRAGPVSRVATSMAELLGDKGAPTHYGMTSLDEGFAECFALFHADPAALLRARPEAHAWFEAGKHVEAAAE